MEITLGLGACRICTESYELTLLSNNNQVCLIDTFFNLVKGLSEIHIDKICLFVSTIYNAIQVVDEMVHKLNQLDFLRPLTPEIILTVSKYAIKE